VSGFIGVAIVLGLAVLFAWLSTRAWRLRNTAIRIVGGLLTALLTLVFAAVSIVGLLGVYRLYTPHGQPAASITIRATPDQLTVAGRRVSGCAGCHSSTGALPLDGGTTNFLGGANGGMGPGVLVPPNLTPGGALKDWSDGEIVRAIREGIDRDGHPLMIMPSDAFHHLAEEDVQNLVAFLRSQPAVQHATPARDINLLGLLLVGGGLFPTAEQSHISQPQAAPPPGTPAYGQYLVDTTGCASCHGPNLTGGRPNGGFGPPVGPSLRAIVPQWAEADFVKFFRTGQDPYGRSIDPALMPWKAIGGAYTDDELRVIYAYLHGLT
jgi:mono/diheme cytochrome c family protein